MRARACDACRQKKKQIKGKEERSERKRDVKDTGGGEGRLVSGL